MKFIEDVEIYEVQETLAMLKILTLGRKEIEQGKYRCMDDVFADLDKDEKE